MTTTPPRRARRPAHQPADSAPTMAPATAPATTPTTVVTLAQLRGLTSSGGQPWSRAMRPLPVRPPLGG